MAGHLSDPLGQDVLLIYDPQRRTASLLSNLPWKSTFANSCHPHRQSAKCRDTPPSGTALLRDASCTVSPATLLPSSGPLRPQCPRCLPPQPLTAALRAAPVPRPPILVPSLKPGVPVLPLPARGVPTLPSLPGLPRPAARGGGGAERHPLRRQVPGTLRLRSGPGAGLPPRAGRHSRAGPEVPPRELSACRGSGVSLDRREDSWRREGLAGSRPGAEGLTLKGRGAKSLSPCCFSFQRISQPTCSRLIKGLLCSRTWRSKMTQTLTPALTI